ncbi:hypothetical protein EYC84_003378 [Monilinia fructicola]|uniref:hydroxyacylglutathione hydrolase n=1 Tax=Monilinia fructicola TaxID=38448 RepID=A0A5M9JXD1_MONFR|nr:hypothetical protein EYC84_003378 [Monilinia fructicola]
MGSNDIGERDDEIMMWWMGLFSTMIFGTGHWADDDSIIFFEDGSDFDCDYDYDCDCDCDDEIICFLGRFEGWVDVEGSHTLENDLVDEKSRDAVIIDPANPEEVAPVLKEQIKEGKINLIAIVNTHHHWDHAGGNNKLLAHPEFKGKPIIGGKDCEGVTKTPKNGEGFKIGEIDVKALYTPCHTQDSICWFMEDGKGEGVKKAVFTGDTLFHGGCGRFFEGTAEEMHTALNKTLAAVPDDTFVYPGHEYTKANVKFAVSVSQSEAIKALEAFADKNKQTQGKFTIGDEKKHNVFMRVEDPVIQEATGETDPVEVMAKLRELKNNFKEPVAKI